MKSNKDKNRKGRAIIIPIAMLFIFLSISAIYLYHHSIQPALRPIESCRSQLLTYVANYCAYCKQEGLRSKECVFPNSSWVKDCQIKLMEPDCKPYRDVISCLPGEVIRCNELGMSLPP